MGIAEQAAGQDGGQGRHRQPEPVWPGRDDSRRRAGRRSTNRPTRPAPTRHARPEVGPTTPVPATRPRSTGPTGDAPDAEADQPAEPEPLPPHLSGPPAAPIAPAHPAPVESFPVEPAPGKSFPAEAFPAEPAVAGAPTGLGEPAGVGKPAEPHLSGTLAPRTTLTSEPAAAGLGAAGPVDPLVDSGSVGLRMFNLGTIPASVTPPRSWRRAAWFAVAASVAALAGLLVAGALLVAPAHDHGRITALPYFPDGSPLRTLGGPTDEPTTLGHHHDQTTVRPDDRPAGQPAGTPAAAAGPATGTATPVPSASGTPGTWGDDPTSTTPDPPANPPVLLPSVTDDTVTVTGGATGDPVVDPATMVRRTRTFFAEVTSNAQAAANLTTGALHDDAVALIRQRYGDVSSIKIERISLDPSNGVTVCLLRVVNKDGTAQTQQTTLHFTLSSDPKITNPGG